MMKKKQMKFSPFFLVLILIPAGLWILIILVPVSVSIPVQASLIMDISGDTRLYIHGVDEKGAYSYTADGLSNTPYMFDYATRPEGSIVSFTGPRITGFTREHFPSFQSASSCGGESVLSALMHGGMMNGRMMDGRMMDGGMNDKKHGCGQIHDQPACILGKPCPSEVSSGEMSSGVMSSSKMSSSVMTQWLLQNGTLRKIRNAYHSMMNWDGTGLVQYATREGGERPIVHQIQATGNSRGNITFFPAFLLMFCY